MISSTDLYLAPGVYAAACGPDLVLLDARRDRYFCLPDAAQGLRGDLAAGGLHGLDPDLGAELAAVGLARSGDTVGRDRLVFTPPERDLALSACASVRGGEGLDFAAALGALAGTYWRQPFQRVLLHAAHRRLALVAASPDNPVLLRRALAFRALLPWSPIQGACLMQAALLLTHLARAGITADWMFGVRVWPFSAHCWVQAGDLVLNDTVERVAPYAPILKV